MKPLFLLFTMMYSLLADAFMEEEGFDRAGSKTQLPAENPFSMSAHDVSALYDSLERHSMFYDDPQESISKPAEFETGNQEMAERCASVSLPSILGSRPYERAQAPFSDEQNLSLLPLPPEMEALFRGLDRIDTSSNAVSITSLSAATLLARPAETPLAHRKPAEAGRPLVFEPLPLNLAPLQVGPEQAIGNSLMELSAEGDLSALRAADIPAARLEEVAVDESREGRKHRARKKRTFAQSMESSEEAENYGTVKGEPLVLEVNFAREIRSKSEEREDKFSKKYNEAQYRREKEYEIRRKVFVLVFLADLPQFKTLKQEMDKIREEKKLDAGLEGLKKRIRELTKQKNLVPKEKKPGLLREITRVKQTIYRANNPNHMLHHLYDRLIHEGKIQVTFAEGKKKRGAFAPLGRNYVEIIDPAT